MKGMPHFKGFFVATIFSALFLTGCATSAPHATFNQKISASTAIRANDEIAIKVASAPGVSMVNYEKERLTQRIQEKLESKKALNAPNGEKKSAEIAVTVTTYDKGSAFARAMLAGLGQIHIVANVKVYLMPAHEQIGDFNINKTFAWGGMYGASTTIEDAEMGFAEGVANALTGHEEVPSPPRSPKR